jgi:hypothetical protein
MANRNILSQGAMPHTRAALSSRSRVFGVNPRNTETELELIGAISNFAISSSRNIEPIRGIGVGDHIVEMVPGQSDPVELQVTRFALCMSNIFQEFGYFGGTDGLVRALKHHRYPVDIKHELLISKLASGKAMTSLGLDNAPVVKTDPKQPGTQGKVHPQATAEPWKGYDRADNLEDSNFGFTALITWYEGCWFSSYNVAYPVDTAAITEDATLIVTDVSGFANGEVVIPFVPSGVKQNASRIWFLGDQDLATDQPASV